MSDELQATIDSLDLALKNFWSSADHVHLAEKWLNDLSARGEASAIEQLPDVLDSPLANEWRALKRAVDELE